VSCVVVVRLSGKKKKKLNIVPKKRAKFDLQFVSLTFFEANKNKPDAPQC
jgi:hypothetical protein